MSFTQSTAGIRMTHTASSPSSSAPSPEAGDTRLLSRIGLFAGPALALLVAWWLPDGYRAASGETVALDGAARATAALAVWMAVWWMTEAIPVYVTALMPLALMPLLGIGSIREAAAPYGNEVIFLFLGGFLLALSMQRWGLDRRLAYRVLGLTGARADRIVLGFMIVTAMLSMWVSNTATAMTVYPIAVSVLLLARPAIPEGSFSNLAHAVLLGVAYAASIGGVGVMISTPPNLFLVTFARETYGLDIGFFQWMLFSMPLTLLFLPLSWWILTRVFPVRGLRIEGMGRLMREALTSLGAPGRGEKTTLLVFAVAVAAWVFRPLLANLRIGEATPLAGLSDPGIAILAALVLFVLPGDPDERGARRPVMDWSTASRLPYGLLILFGGGLSLAGAMERNGLGEFLGAQLVNLQGMPMWVFIALAVVGVMFAGELISNTAAAAIFIPICAAAAQGLGWNPMIMLIPVVWAANCSFMLPVATPPNAIVYGSGWIDAAKMARVGIRLNIAGIVLMLALAYAFAGWLFPQPG